ncbi:MAG TPA: hypothetical protein VF572_01150 [Candidatus Saccharimonadales bacterium]|jgi:hypothetical protein
MSRPIRGKKASVGASRVITLVLLALTAAFWLAMSYLIILILQSTQDCTRALVDARTACGQTDITTPLLTFLIPWVLLSIALWAGARHFRRLQTAPATTRKSAKSAKGKKS